MNQQDREPAANLKVLDLFSGSGGMSTGFHRNGNFQIVGAVDFEKAKPSQGPGATSCNQTYLKNIGLAPLFADLSVIEPKAVAEHFDIDGDSLDVLISCAPCTGFSQKQSSNHSNDDARNFLVERTGEFVEFFQPKFLVMENVKELAKGRHKHHLQNLVNHLDRIGYSTTFEVHNLADFGLPQNRIRTLLIAKRGGRPPKIHFAESARQSVRDAIGHLATVAADGSIDPMHICPTTTKHVLERMQAIPRDGGSWIDIPQSKKHLLIPSMDLDDPGSYPDIYGRLSWDKAAPTITRECSSPGNGRYTHPELDRLLTVREMALIQGFPNDYHFVGNLSSKYRQIGDAVPPFISSMIAQLIVENADSKVKAVSYGLFD